MIGPPMAPRPAPHDEPSRDEIEARLAALSSRVPSRRSTDSTDLVVRPGDEIEAADTLARLAALAAQLDRIGRRP